MSGWRNNIINFSNLAASPLSIVDIDAALTEGPIDKISKLIKMTIQFYTFLQFLSLLQLNVKYNLPIIGRLGGKSGINRNIIFLQHGCNESFRMQTNSLYDYERIHY